jgi:hypothetical protein
MKLHRLIPALLALTAVLAPQSPGTALAQSDKRRYSATLMSPRPGQILQPGKVVRIAWMANFPDVDLSMCETEVLLSLDGGEYAHQPGGTGHSLRLSKYLSRDFKSSASIAFCDWLGASLIVPAKIRNQR